MPPPAAHPSRTRFALPVVLGYLTFLSGYLDALSYLALGRVFTANMTGNVVVLGFAAGGAAGFSVPASATSIGGFLLGAVLGGRLVTHRGPAPRWMDAALAVETAGTAVAGVLEAAHTSHYGPIAILAVALGCRNAAIRKLGVADITTTVLTGTLTSLAADSPLAGGDNPRLLRRAGSVALMLLGALTGSAYLHATSLPTGLLTAAAADTLLLLAYLAATRYRTDPAHAA